MAYNTTIVEVCPECGSVDVLVAEPRWFAIDIERRAALGAEVDVIDRVEFGCRDCGVRWD